MAADRGARLGMPRLSLRAKLVLSAALVLAPVLGLLLWAFEASYDRRREIVLDSLEQTAQAVAIVSDVTFDEAIAVGRALASDPEVQSLNPGVIVPRLRWLAPLYPEYENISVYDAAGNLRGESAEFELGLPRNIADRPYFQRALASGDPTAVEVVLSRRTAQPVSGAAVPFFDADERPLGVLLIAFDFARLQARLESVGLLPGQAIWLLDPTGRLAIATGEPDLPWDERDLAQLPAIEQAMASQAVRTTRFQRTPDDERWALALTRSPKYGWIAGIGGPAAYAFAPAEHARSQELLAFGGIALLSLMGATLLAGYVSSPIRRLAVQARAIGLGHLDRRVTIRTGDELEQLGSAFNTMAEQLQGSLAQLETARSAAEQGRAEAEAAQARTAFVAEVGAVLASSLEYETTLQRLAHLTVPRVADWCVVDIVEPDGTIRRVAAAHADPDKQELVRELQQSYQARPAWENHPIGRVLGSGEPELLAELAPDQLEIMARDPNHLRLLQQLGVASMMVVPLLARGRTLGTLTLVTARPDRCYGLQDLELARSVAVRAALAVDNARLYREAELAVRVRDEFLAASSHELRTPLAHIKGFVSTLRQTDVEWDNETRLDFLAEIEREADRLAKLIGDLLDMSRLESGGLDSTERAEVRPRDLVAGGLDRVRSLVNGRPVHVDVPVTLPAVMVDASQIERVVANLVENAVKYGRPAGSITLTASTDDGWLELRVDDEGPGIPPAHLERVFEKFFRVKTNGASVHGTGLGLAICRRIVETHGGQIHAENHDRGARLVIRLPLAQEVVGSTR